MSNLPSIPAQIEPDPTPATGVIEIPSGEECAWVEMEPRSDTLVVSRGINPDIKPTVTQKVVLSLVSSVYDPIAPVAPYTVKARLLLKDIWRLSGQQWDNDLLHDIVTNFLDWTQELPALSDIAIARAYVQRKVEALERHIFGDISQDVFSAVVFLRGKVFTGNGCPQTKLAFVFRKARVAPMNALTIPKLVLQDSLLAARLRKDIQKALTLEISRMVLQFIHSPEKQPFFVANRVAEILELTTADEWNYVQSSGNPADAGTGGLSASALLESNWLKGPEFLKCPNGPLSHPKTSDGS